MKDRYRRNANKERIEGIFDIDLFCFKDFQSIEGSHNSSTEEKFKFKSRVSFYDECYGNQTIWMTIVIFEILEEDK